MKAEVAEHDEKLQGGGECLVDAFDHHSVHRRHVIGHARHDFARRFRIEPFHWKALQFIIELHADQVGDAHFEHVIKIRANREKKLSSGNRTDAHEGGW